MILRVAPEGTRVTMVHRDGSTREVETRGITGRYVTIWWPLCGAYLVNLHTGMMSSTLDWGLACEDEIELWRMRADDLAAVRAADDPDRNWPEIEPWPPQRA
jgi:hypothetical protein